MGTVAEGNADPGGGLGQLDPPQSIVFDELHRQPHVEQPRIPTGAGSYISHRDLYMVDPVNPEIGVHRGLLTRQLPDAPPR